MQVSNRMARPSKRNEIAMQSLPLFLENGFKGTSIDMVVVACRVSKPTVYRHFPDKNALLVAALEYWRDVQPGVDWSTLTASALWLKLEALLLTPEAVRLLALCIGEGQRFPDAQRVIFKHVERAWRAPLEQWAKQHGLDVESFVREFDQRLLRQLMTPAVEQ